MAKTTARQGSKSISPPTDGIRPQPGPQEAFLSSPADIAILGGAAGGGKSYALLLEALRHIDNPQFGAVIFRRTLADVKKQGSLFDTSMPLYGEVKGTPRLDNLTWTFPKGSKVAFGHLEHETTVFNWQGSQIPMLAFDELTHFSRSQFFYMLSRNRSSCGIRPYIRATTNPDADSWVAEFIAWWIDQDTGMAIPERSGILRWFVRIGDELCWADTKEELQAQYEGCEPKSLTFIPARLEDNAILVKADPGYRANLLALPLVERERLLGGNWKIRPAAGLYFRREWCEVVDAIPAGAEFVRYWDLAATEKTSNNDPDWTVGVKMARANGVFYITNVVRTRSSPMMVEQILKNTASADGFAVRVGLPQDPGQAGKSQAEYFVRQFAGFQIITNRETGDKVTRFGPFSSQAQGGNVKILRAAMNEDFLLSLEGFPDRAHDDDADVCSGAFAMLMEDAFSADMWKKLAGR